ncbi:hypothetical protein [Ancylobacter amanitiformis]|uniref:Uncharacterized protein n=1 Tax=Ancylobacter amanitiformis TaxID=217069 RepID=A0ABU0LQK8_9HYPH|nr:hypothetical protein [Ancylobacter amanitiformis]MDQ0510948.1 hypothetical protein [Ancylobacter amanitiformis]
MAEPRWHWRNCRDIGFSAHLFPLTWHFGFEKDADVYGGNWRLGLGPIGFTLHASIGHCSSENRFEAWLGMSESEAWERACKYEGRADG